MCSFCAVFESCCVRATSRKYFNCSKSIDTSQMIENDIWLRYYYSKSGSARQDFLIHPVHGKMVICNEKPHDGTVSSG